MEPVFSILIPVYKVEKYISQCLESVLAQTFESFEAICVDDCGGDDSVKIIEEFVKKDNRIKLIRHNKNLGLSGARNSALEKARGEYIVCLDSDDWLEADCLEVLYREFNVRKTNSIWFDAYKFDETIKQRLEEPVSGNRGGYMEITPQNICRCTDYSWIKAYKTSSIKEHNLKWPEGLTFEDGEFYFKYFTLNPKTYIIENCLYNYRIREGSIVTNAQAGKVKLGDIYQVVRNIREFYIENGLYQKYKNALLELVYMRIKTCRTIRGQYRKSVKMSNELINDFGYPEEFIEFEQEKSPVFSVIVPIYNVEKYVEKCIKSIQSQSFNDMEILCVDDCGNDNSMNIVKKLAEEDSRIRIIRHKKNKGLGAARNTALKAAKGKYIVCADSDDWLDRRCLEEVFDKFKKTGLNSIWYKCNFWWENEGRMTDMFAFPELLNTPEGFYTLSDKNLASFPMYAWNKAFKREFLIKNKIFWAEGVLFEDMEFGFKAGIVSPEIYIIDKPLYFYRRRGDSIIGECIKDAQRAKSLFQAALGVYKYLVKTKNLNLYKNSFLRYCVDNVNMFRAYPNVHRELLPYMKEFLDKINLSGDVWKIKI